MTMNRIDKTGALVATNGEVIFYSNETDERTDRLNPSLSANFVEIVSQDIDGNAVIPTAGSYEIYVQQVITGNFRAIADEGTVDATLTGGEAMADGTGVSSSFVGNPIAVKVKAIGVDVAAQFYAVITQNENA